VDHSPLPDTDTKLPRFSLVDAGFDGRPTPPGRVIATHTTTPPYHHPARLWQGSYMTPEGALPPRPQALVWFVDVIPAGSGVRGLTGLTTEQRHRTFPGCQPYPATHHGVQTSYLRRTSGSHRDLAMLPYRYFL